MSHGRGRAVWPVIPMIAMSLVITSCVASPPPPAPGRGTLYGRITLQPHEGVTPGVPGTTVYRDRRLRNVEYVDYETPGPGVVYLAGSSETRTGVEPIAFEGGILGSPRFLPNLLALGPGGTVRLTNRDDAAHVFSCPEAKVLRSVGARQSVDLVDLPRGPLHVFALDVPGSSATLFAAPGPAAVVPPSGAWELRDLEPGTYALRVWHPRFPSAERRVTIQAGTLLRVDVALRVEDAPREDSP